MFAFRISFILAAASLAAAVPFKGHNGGHNGKLASTLIKFMVQPSRSADRSLSPSLALVFPSLPVENVNDDNLIDTADAVALVDVLDKRVSFHNGGHNVVNTVDDDLVDSKDTSALLDVLKRQPSEGKVSILSPLLLYFLFLSHRLHRY